MVLKEYTILAIVSVLCAVIVERLTRVHLLTRREYYLFLSVIFVFKWLVNGYLTGENIVLYNPDFYSSIRLGTIPLEDFFFGFSMVTLTITLWEYFSKVEHS